MPMTDTTGQGGAVTEASLEAAALDWFRGLGYQVLRGPDTRRTSRSRRRRPSWSRPRCIARGWRRSECDRDSVITQVKAFNSLRVRRST